MNPSPIYANLPGRAVVIVSGPHWRSFLQGLLTQDVETEMRAEMRFAALLTPQGRILFDLFLSPVDGGCRLDCATEYRNHLVEKLLTYRLRAKVDFEVAPTRVMALWGAEGAPGFFADPRLPALGWRGYDAPAPDHAVEGDEKTYWVHCLNLGAPGTADWGSDTTYPIEANFDLLNGVDFKKGCFVGQETTSRMKRRGLVKTRMVPVVYDGAAPGHGAELLAGDLRAGQVLAGTDGKAMALVRLDRLNAGTLRIADGRACSPAWPDWLSAALSD